MNTQLEKLFALHDFSPKDRYDFLQIYSLLPDFKKSRVVDYFEDIVAELNILKQELHLEQEILFGETLKNIEEKLSSIKKKKVLSSSKQEISLLKNMI